MLTAAMDCNLIFIGDGMGTLDAFAFAQVVRELETTKPPASVTRRSGRDHRHSSPGQPTSKHFLHIPDPSFTSQSPPSIPGELPRIGQAVKEDVAPLAASLSPKEVVAPVRLPQTEGQPASGAAFSSVSPPVVGPTGKVPSPPAAVASPPVDKAGASSKPSPLKTVFAEKPDS